MAKMKMKPETGGPAYPVSITAASDGSVYHSGEVFEGSEGMRMRDYFAGKALIGLMTCEYTNGMCAPTCTADPETLARWSYLQADAMIKERNREQ